MVTMLAARWRLGHELYRETGDVDLGITPIIARDHHAVRRLQDLDGVHSRHEAVDRARALGLLAPSAPTA